MAGRGVGPTGQPDRDRAAALGQHRPLGQIGPNSHATAPSTRSAFAGFGFPPEVIVLALDRWVQRFTPLLAEAARPCRHAVGDRWHVQETSARLN